MAETLDPGEPNTQSPEETLPDDVASLLIKPDAIPLAHVIYQLWQRWANFELMIVSPVLPSFNPPHIIPPEPLPNHEGTEFVYPIHDYGNKFKTSKQEELLSAGFSMCKLHYTIEKIIALLVKRLKEGGIDEEDEVQIAFSGHESSQRKGFESVINLKNNIVVINFEPGEWGERYLEIVKGPYGTPPEAPRDIYRRSYTQNTPKPKK